MSLVDQGGLVRLCGKRPTGGGVISAVGALISGPRASGPLMSGREGRGPNMKRGMPETLDGKTLDTGEGTSEFLKCGRQPTEKTQKIL
jgi:hypothetical protein